MKKAEELSKKLSYKRKNFWREASANEKKLTFKFAEGYKAFLDQCKTEREAIEFYANILEKKGFVEIDKASKSAKVYRLARKKNAAIAVLGKKPVSEGVNIIVSHIDAPRVDLKQNPLYEDGDTKLGMMRTHYYGGKKIWQDSQSIIPGAPRKSRTGQLFIFESGNSWSHPFNVPGVWSFQYQC